MQRGLLCAGRLAQQSDERARQIKLYFIVPVGWPAKSLDEWDAIRDEIGAAIGGEGPNRWLTIALTTDPAWSR